MFLQCGGYRASSLRAEYWQADASNKAGLIVEHKADRSRRRRISA